MAIEVNRKKYQVVPNPNRAEKFMVRHTDREKVELGIPGEPVIAVTEWYQSFKAIGHCKGKSIGRIIDSEVLSVSIH